jgi:hypothetical protein
MLEGLGRKMVGETNKNLWLLIKEHAHILLLVITGITTFFAALSAIAYRFTENPWQNSAVVIIYVIGVIAIAILWILKEKRDNDQLIIKERNDNSAALTRKDAEAQSRLSSETEKLSSQLRAAANERMISDAKHAQDFSVCAEKLHFAVHTIRDEYRRLLDGVDRSIEEDNLKEYSLLCGNAVVNMIADFLSQCTAQTVSVCLKILDNPYESVTTSEVDLRNKWLTTLCRSTNSQKTRTEKDLHSIVGNTAFQDILEKKDQNYYVSSDLMEEARRGNYTNTTKNWSQFYKSTIVVPIRLFTGQVGEAGNLRPVYDLYGFLCADANSVNGLESNRIHDYANFMMVVADAMYHYFDLLAYLANKDKTEATPTEVILPEAS